MKVGADGRWVRRDHRTVPWAEGCNAGAIPNFGCGTGTINLRELRKSRSRALRLSPARNPRASLVYSAFQMKRFTLILLAALALLAPARPARALQQNIALGARLGTLGVGADAAFALNERVALRGGAGLYGFGVNLTGRFGLADNRTAELSLPSAMFTVGAEVSFGILRAGAGLLIRAGNPVYAITYGDGASIDIGGGYYTQPEVRTLATTLVSGSVAPYALLGFAPSLSRGIALLVDLGAAFPRDAGFEMSATGDPAVLGSDRFRADLESERREAEDDAGRFLSFWPIVSVGLRYRF